MSEQKASILNSAINIVSLEADKKLILMGVVQGLRIADMLSDKVQHRDST